LAALCRPNRAGHYIFALWFLSSFIYLYFFFSSPNLSSHIDWMSTILLHMGWPYSANLEGRSEMCCTRLAANTGRKKVAKNRHLSMAELRRARTYIFATMACIDNRKKLVKQQSSTCPHNTVNFDPLAAEIVSLVWGTPANLNGFLVLAALLHAL